MLKEMKPGRRYFIINIDEPYAGQIYEVLKRGQMAKGPKHWPEGDISYDEWKRQTFGEEPDWEKAESWLKQVEQMYTGIGSAGYLGLTLSIRPLRDRLNSGERTQELYDAIMSLE